MFLTMLKNANLALAFLLELGVLAALGFWGFYTGQECWPKSRSASAFRRWL